MRRYLFLAPVFGQALNGQVGINTSVFIMSSDIRHKMKALLRAGIHAARQIRAQLIKKEAVCTQKQYTALPDICNINGAAFLSPDFQTRRQDTRFYRRDSPGFLRRQTAFLMR